MFKLKKENVVKLTESSEQKDKLIKQGYQLVAGEDVEPAAGQTVSEPDNTTVVTVDSDKGNEAVDVDKGDETEALDDAAAVDKGDGNDKAGKQSTRRGRSGKNAK